MARARNKTNWAGFPLAVAVAGLVALFVTTLFRPGWAVFVQGGTSALLGIAFLWAFGKRDVWWAVIAGIGFLAMALICLVFCVLLGSVVWLGLLILGLAAYVIAVIPNDKVWINVFYLVGLILVLVAIYLSPIVQVWQIILAVAFVLLLVLTLWLDREDLARIWD